MSARPRVRAEILLAQTRSASNSRRLALLSKIRRKEFAGAGRLKPSDQTHDFMDSAHIPARSSPLPQEPLRGLAGF
jgi:hypothetical protein